ncbi:putative Diguanylate cyclase [Nitrospira moscoviensis]|uniref:diguanylate cyclase n=2 Tax=Nitrospira moscoviensis TaxID=42253 RepID=A0A0K2GC90_NITMO|nr:putative Diguanylate cyclase [Nitrospira moscoviensis]
MLLVANAAVRQAPLWQTLSVAPVAAYSHRAFDVGRHLVPDMPLVIYQMDRRSTDTLRFLDRASAIQSDLCIILLGKEIGAERVATLLRHGAFDYLTWPCSSARLRRAIVEGLANRRMFLEVRNLSDELARTNQALAQDRDALSRWNRTLAGLTDLTQALAASLDPDAVVRTLFDGLPELIQADAVGVAKNNPAHAWAWTRRADAQNAEELRRRLHDLVGAPHTEPRAARPEPGFSPRARLTLVPKAAATPPGTKVDSATAIQIPLSLGPQSLGVLHLERAGRGPFTDQERQLLATVGTSVALSLRNADSHRHLQDLALRDPLTGLLNRRALDGPLARELKAGLRYGAPACLILLDLDYFKTVNDRLGHQAGDEVLRDVAALLSATVRDVDSVARYGGEEFAVVLPHTDLAQADRLAERIRAAIERRAFQLSDGQVRITASFGVAAPRRADSASVADWIAAADQALYLAKAQGRNRVVTQRPGSSSPAAAAALCVAA